eukprot:5227268-Prymnesium_polylepis.1
MHWSDGGGPPAAVDARDDGGARDPDDESPGALLAGAVDIGIVAPSGKKARVPMPSRPYTPLP